MHILLRSQAAGYDRDFEDHSTKLDFQQGWPGCYVDGVQGVGKSTLLFMCAAAAWILGHLLFYVPDATKWVKEASENACACYFLDQFKRLNIDISEEFADASKLAGDRKACLQSVSLKMEDQERRDAWRLHDLYRILADEADWNHNTQRRVLEQLEKMSTVGVVFVIDEHHQICGRSSPLEYFYPF